MEKVVGKECPNCGASLDLGKPGEVVVCQYCNSEFTVEKKEPIIIHNKEYVFRSSTKTVKQTSGHKSAFTGFIVFMSFIAFIMIGTMFVIFFSKLAMTASEANQKKRNVYTQDETATYKGVDYSILKVERTDSGGYVANVTEYITFTVKIDNNAKGTVIVSPGLWILEDSEGKDIYNVVNSSNQNSNLKFVGLTPGNSITGNLTYIVNKGETGLRLKHVTTSSRQEVILEFYIVD
jgi:DNA-directed RNA polymerase subunit RPC12/RpoP